VAPTKAGGRPPKHSRREILNGIFYAVRSGGAWKLLAHDLPPWRTVYHYFRFWRRSGVWQQESVRTGGTEVHVPRETELGSMVRCLGAAKQ
jgi:transposase